MSYLFIGMLYVNYLFIAVSFFMLNDFSSQTCSFYVGTVALFVMLKITSPFHFLICLITIWLFFGPKDIFNFSLVSHQSFPL